MPIQFEAKISKIGPLNLIRLPKNASDKLPSRGLTMVKGTINSSPFEDALEPDGKGSHWIKVNKGSVGEKVSVELEPIKEWPEPEVPEDLQKALDSSPQAKKTWQEITPMARWDWIRWIRSTKNPETRKIRIEKTFSKFKDGIRRPCCFNRTQCTDPNVSHNGILLDA